MLTLAKIGIDSDALSDVVPFIQFKRRENHPWRRVTFSKFLVTFVHGFTFFKHYKSYQISQSITIIEGKYLQMLQLVPYLQPKFCNGKV